jgi:hypothetical protein
MAVHSEVLWVLNSDTRSNPYARYLRIGTDGKSDADIRVSARDTRLDPRRTENISPQLSTA